MGEASYHPEVRLPIPAPLADRARGRPIRIVPVRRGRSHGAVHRARGASSSPGESAILRSVAWLLVLFGAPPRITMRNRLFGCLGLILGLITVLLLAYYIVGHFLPDTCEAERTVIVNAPIEEIHPLLDDLHRWPEWMEWLQGEGIEVTYEGPARGVGATMTYAWKEGSSTLKIMRSDPATGLGCDWIFSTERMATKIDVTWVADGTGTVLTWKQVATLSSSPNERWGGLGYDFVVGRQLDLFLSNMKRIAEE